MSVSKELDFDRISKYYQQIKKSGFFQDVSGKLWNDLGMDDVFTVVDRTTTKYGQQFLYRSLRLVRRGPLVDERAESKIQVYEINPGFESFVTRKLESLVKNDSYFLCKVFQREAPQNPWYFILFYILSGLSIVGLIASFFAQWMVFLTMLFITFNFIIH
jgi:hypothetical protein